VWQLGNDKAARKCEQRAAAAAAAAAAVAKENT
jgi:hypothetical protein